MCDPPRPRTTHFFSVASQPSRPIDLPARGSAFLVRDCAHGHSTASHALLTAYRSLLLPAIRAFAGGDAAVAAAEQRPRGCAAHAQCAVQPRARTNGQSARALQWTSSRASLTSGVGSARPWRSSGAANVTVKSFPLCIQAGNAANTHARLIGPTASLGLQHSSHDRMCLDASEMHHCGSNSLEHCASHLRPCPSMHDALDGCFLTVDTRCSAHRTLAAASRRRRTSIASRSASRQSMNWL